MRFIVRIIYPSKTLRHTALINKLHKLQKVEQMCYRSGPQIELGNFSPKHAEL